MTRRARKRNMVLDQKNPKKERIKDCHRDLFSCDLDEECFHENKDCKRSIKKNGVEDLGDEEFLLEEYESE